MISPETWLKASLSSRTKQRIRNHNSIPLDFEDHFQDNSLVFDDPKEKEPNKTQLIDALHSDVYVVFGASYIKGWLIDFLVEHRAINIHMGLSPYYRGSSCNFWALYDNNPSYVGSTIHLLSKGLDSGDMLFHCVPQLHSEDSPFDFTMRSVLVAQQGIVSAVENKSIFSAQSVKQDKSQEVRYTKNQDFTDDVAKEFLERNLQLNADSFSYPVLLNPIFG